MAGETPRAAQSRRRKLAWHADRSTDKIYASGQSSTVTPPGEAPPPRPAMPQRRRGRTDLRSADEYYAAQPATNNAQRIQKARATRNAAAPKQVTTTAAAAAEIVDNIVARLERGEAPVRVAVPAKLTARVRAALDLLVTREMLSEGAYHDIVLLKETDPTKSPPALPAPAALATARGVRQADPPVLTDPAAFLAVGGDAVAAAEMDVLSAATGATALKTPKTVKPAAPAAPVSQIVDPGEDDDEDEEDEEDSDFLANVPPARNNFLAPEDL